MRKGIFLALELLNHKLCLRFHVSPDIRKSLAERDKKIISGFKKGHSIPHLTRVFSLTPNRISQILINYGARKPKWRKMSPGRRKIVFQLHEKGLSHSAIGRRVGVTRERIRQILTIKKGIKV